MIFWEPVLRIYTVESIVYVLLRPFLQLCLLNLAPQDLPASRMLLGLSASAYLLVSAAMGWPAYGLGLSLVQAVVDLGILLIFTWGVLSFRRHSERFLQTASALAGVGAVFGVLLLPLVYALYRAELLHQPAELAMLSYLVVLVWLLVVFGNIFRHALGLRHLALGIGVALGFVLFASAAIQMMFPAQQVTP